MQAWLIITVANICKDQLRRSRRRELPLEAAANAAAPSERGGGLREAVLQLLPKVPLLLPGPPRQTAVRSRIRMRAALQLLSLFSRII